MPKPSLDKAAAYAAVAKKTGGAFVFATRDPSILSLENASAVIAKHNFSEFACKDCGSHHSGVSVAGMAPYCVVCGGDTQELDPANPTIPSDSEMAYVQCSSCGTHTVMHEAVASIGDSVHCSVCGTEMKTHADLDGMSGVLPQVDDMELIDIDTDSDNFDITDEDTELSDSTHAPASDAKPQTLSPDAVNPSTTTQGLPSETLSDDLTQDPVSPSTTQQELVASEEVEIDMMDELEGEEDLEVSFVYHGAKLSLMSNEQIVATLSPETAGANADIIQTEQFRAAVAHSVQSLGLKKAVAQYNFTPKRLKVSLSKTLARKVEARVQERSKVLDLAQNQIMEDVKQAVAIAAAGFASNFWRDRVDPLKTALLAEARALNVRKPQEFVDRLFAAHSVEHHQAVIELAQELIKKPVEARNALADAIDLSRYLPMVVKAEAYDDEGEESDDGDDDTDDSEVATIATPVHASIESAASTGSLYRTPELRNILGNQPLYR